MLLKYMFFNVIYPSFYKANNIDYIMTRLNDMFITGVFVLTANFHQITKDRNG